MKSFAHFLTVAALAAMAAAPAAAKPLGRMLAESGLTPADFDMIRAAESSLLSRTPLQAGRSAEWSNPDSGSHGTARLTGVQGDCVITELTAHPKGASEAKTVNRKLCHRGGGRWQLQP